jgi:hypothetical protein
MMEKLRGKHTDECRFSIAGPCQSGKSTLLFIAAWLFHEKLKLSGQFSWSNHQNHISEIPALHEFMITMTCDCLRGSRPDLRLILAPLRQWFFTLIVIQAVPPLPALAVRFEDIPKSEIIQVGPAIHSAEKNKTDLEHFVQTVIACPGNTACCFGFTSIVPIFDHFDVRGYLISLAAIFHSVRNR